MTNESFTLDELWELIHASWDRMSKPQRRLWETLRIPPQKWQQHPYGDTEEGFWAVAVIGRNVIWYNHVEKGFNRSQYTRYGEIDDYWANRDNLEWVVQHLLIEINEGRPSAYFPPKPKPAVKGQRPGGHVLNKLASLGKRYVNNGKSKKG